MNYEYEKLCAARALLGEMELVNTWLYLRRRALMEDLVALEREHDERAMQRRRKRLKRLVLLEQTPEHHNFWRGQQAA